jgi:porphobilinogen synthase|tara:strand:- start:1024 stop:2016 length:993 start_codon:yes stop_codon:yes gene_type:complete
MSFPNTRLRRLRYNSLLRELVSETQLSVNDLIYPLFVCEGEKIKNEIPSMPGQFQFSIDNLIKKCKQVQEKGIKAILIFGVSKNKDKTGDIACSENSIVQRAIKAIKEENINLLLIADVCNCEYTSHGHCGTIVDGDVENDLTLNTLAKQSLSLVRAGADIIAPSDMMDGRVQAIRKVLDSSGFYKVPILSYSAKYASSFYSPFRDAADSSPKGFDRKTYQMNYSNSDEAIREVEQDVLEGADMIMIKPALSYLDIISKVKQNFSLPIVAYSVSGEYSMIKAASLNNWINENDMMMETITSIKRAGADIIITYYALEIADVLNKKNNELQ